uniref:Beta-defensin-like domain-containing protein n=1 Tax=Terrapene triunguis TaxID=2587831 RepID=A0A674J6F6_9SAUR
MKIKTLFICAGFTQDSPSYPEACIRAGGFCQFNCPPLSTPIGICGFVQSCCKWR